jgi:tRNA(fMet)-specific endonuclease VapC
MFMLDTNICSYILRARPAAVLTKFLEHGSDDLAVSEIVAAELHYGAARAGASRSQAIRADIDDFLSRLSVLPWQGRIEYARIRVHLESVGTPIGAHDLFIAAHALTLGATLVTNNVAEFSRVPGLVLENWV